MSDGSGYKSEFKSNKEYWEELKGKGYLFSSLKDGGPRGFWRLVGLGYPLIVVIFFFVTVYGLLRDGRRMRYGVFFVHLVIGTICGWLWGVFILKFDPEFPAWLFHPWGILGPEWFLTLEDFFFYPVFGAFFYVLYRWVGGSGFRGVWLKWVFQCFHIGVCLFFLYFGAVAGRSIVLQFGLVSVFLFFYAWDRWDVVHYCKLFLFIVSFASFWDWIAVDWLHRLSGMSWLSQWVYLTFDVAGGYHHSKVFLDYGVYGWAWLFSNPIEITPLFGVCGANFTYSLALGLDKFYDTVIRKEVVYE